MVGKLLLSTLFLITVASSAFAQTVVDFSNVVKDGVRRGASSMNLCWLLDSDIKRPNETQSLESALEECGVGSLRFPYGFLANNYLWHTPPYDDVEGGLRPRVATLEVAPSRWEWAVNEDGSFTSAMDFDEYIALCQRQNIAPLVVVNSLAHKMKGGVSLEELVESAVEWVKYADRMGYEVAYWQIGNEMDHHPDMISLEEYLEAYTAIASAMKAVSPDAYIGPGILGSAHFFTVIQGAVPELVDFTSAHQYMWAFKESCKDYDLWSKNDESYIKNINAMQRAVSNSSAPDMEIVITESGISPSGQGMGSINNTYKALWWFELLMSELSVRNVSYSYNWGTHSPWSGAVDSEDDDASVMFRLDDNSRKPTSEVSRFVNRNLGSAFVQSSTGEEGVRIYAMRDGDDGGVIFLMNKLTRLTPISIDLGAIPADVKRLSVNTLSGDDPYSRELKYKKERSIRVKRSTATLNLDPLSITVLRY